MGAAASAVSATRGLTALATRTWDMTITQIECTSNTLPPTGCTKYFWNTNAGRAVLKSSNYQVTTTSIHLGQQHDRYCIRRERGMCVGCFAAADTEFAVSGRKGAGTAPNEVAVSFAHTGGCCGYRTQTGMEADAVEGTTMYGWDCIVIPGAYTTTTATTGTVQTTQSATNLQQILSFTPTAAVRNVGQGPQICGNNKGIGAGIADGYTHLPNDAAEGLIYSLGRQDNLTVCTRSTPFMLEFMSDDLEGLGGATIASIGEQRFTNSNSGFQITHTQMSC